MFDAPPRILSATAEPIPFIEDDEAWMVRDLDLSSLVRLAESRHPWLALDVDSVEGLNADDAAVRFVVGRLGVNAVVSRRPGLACLAAELGAIGLVRIFAFDSTGLRRSIEAVERRPRVGLVISPGIVLPYVEAEQRLTLPRPLFAHGLIDRPAQVARLLDFADAVVIRPDLARQVRAAERLRPQAAVSSDPTGDRLDRAGTGV